MAIDRKMRYPMVLVLVESAPRASGGNPGPSAPGGEPSAAPRPDGDRHRSRIACRSDPVAGSGRPSPAALPPRRPRTAVPRLGPSDGQSPATRRADRPAPPRPAAALDRPGHDHSGRLLTIKQKETVPLVTEQAGQPGRDAPVTPDLSAIFGPIPMSMFWQWQSSPASTSPSPAVCVKAREDAPLPFRLVLSFLIYQPMKRHFIASRN